MSQSTNITEIGCKSFKETDIRPLDENKVLKKLPKETLQDALPNVSGIMMDFLKELRHSTPKPRTKKIKPILQLEKV